MPGCCAVLNCVNRFVRGGKHFYRFPKNEALKKLWVQFTRKTNYDVKTCSAICEDHFDENRVIAKKKGRLYLMKNTVPTIYYCSLDDGMVQKVTVEFDAISGAYVGQESVNLLRRTADEEEQMLMRERNDRMRELRQLCRFCFDAHDDKFVSINKLSAYSVSPEDIISLLGLNPQFNEVFSDIVCESCFQQIITIDGYRKRCQKAQDLIIVEMQDLDVKLESVSVVTLPWFKHEVVEEDETHRVVVDVIEEHLDDNIAYVMEGDESYQGHQTFDNIDYESYKIEPNDESKDFQSIIVKEEEIDQSMDDLIEQTDGEFESYENTIEEEEEEEEEEDEVDTEMFMARDADKDVYHVIDADEVIKNPDRNSFALRVYECFFCRLKFAGKKTFKSHQCSTKEVKCEVDGCDKSFNKLSGYNTHVVKVHGLMKTSKRFCSTCKNVVMATDSQFKHHCRQCNKESEKKDADNPIECEVCNKQCPNLKSYTVHKLFHDSRNLVGTKAKTPGSIISKGPVMCELCGKEFTNAQGLRTHRKNVHRIGVPEDVVYQCDICSKLRPTKRSLFNHMRNVHRVREAQCKVCQKVFRTPALLQKHMMYHDETKRVHTCPMCPDKPGWFTAVALRRHQKSHHLGLKEFQCNVTFCDAAFPSTSALKQHKISFHGYQI